MFDLFSSLEKQIPELLQSTIVSPIGILTTGVAGFSISLMTAWIIYRAYMIMMGFHSEPFFTLIRDLIIRSLILGIAASAGYYNATIGDKDGILITVTNSLAEEFANSSGSNGSIFKSIESKIDGMSLLMEAVSGKPPQNNVEAIEKYGDGNALVKGSMKVIAYIHDGLSNAADSISNILIIVSESIKLTIITVGLLFFGFFAFMTLIFNKIYFLLSLGVGPVFICFAAFDLTRGWFNSWLNTTLGYAFAYPMVMILLSMVMKLFDQYFQVDSNVEVLTFSTSFFFCLLCIVLAIIVQKIGDASSAYFSAGNLTSVSQSLMNSASQRMGGYVNRAGSTSYAAAQVSAQAGVRGTRTLANKLFSKSSTTIQKN